MRRQVCGSIQILCAGKRGVVFRHCGQVIARRCSDTAVDEGGMVFRYCVQARVTWYSDTAARQAWRGVPIHCGQVTRYRVVFKEDQIA